MKRALVRLIFLATAISAQVSFAHGEIRVGVGIGTNHGGYSPGYGHGHWGNGHVRRGWDHGPRGDWDRSYRRGGLSCVNRSCID